MKYSCGSAGSTGHGCSHVQTSVKPTARRRAVGPSGRRVVPRAGPAAEGGLVDGVDRGLDVGDVARPAALGREPPARLQRGVQPCEQAVVVLDPVEGRGGEDRVDGFVEVRSTKAATKASIPRARVCSTIAALPSTAITDPRAGREQLGDAAGAAAGVEDTLVALEVEAVDNVPGHRELRVRDTVVGTGIPFTWRHTSVRYRIRQRLEASRDALGLVGGARDQVRDVGGRAGASGRARRRRRSPGRSSPGRPTPIRTRWKSGAPNSRLSDFSPLWPARPPPSRDADVAERQVDLVVQHEHAVEVELERAAGGPGGAARLVHERLRLEQRDARAARAVRPSKSSASNFFFALAQVPAASELVGDLEADVVRRLRVAGPGVAEPDDQPVDRCGGEELQDSSEDSAPSLAGLRRPLRPRQPRRPRPRAPSRSRSRPRPARGSAG